MRDRTLCFPIQGNPVRKVLLGFKKTGFGAGKYAGFGGKVEAGESVASAAVRELEEEAGIRAAEGRLERMAHLTFRFPAEPSWSQVVHAFLVTAWDGDPTESAEMEPAWFPVDDLPFGRMWQDNAHWLPRVLAGERVRAVFYFKGDNETIDHWQIEGWDGKVQEEQLNYDPDACYSCGLCVTVCPVDATVMQRRSERADRTGK
jgi:8-oxo-dGTP pyrophosphatase MutT (NUDIX family)